MVEALWIPPMAGESLSAPLRETLDVFHADSAPLTTSEVADRLDFGRRSTYARLDRLVEEGYLLTKKVGASGRVWWRSLPSSDSVPSDGSVGTGAEVPFSAYVDPVEECAIVVLASDGTIQTWNAGAERLFGYHPDEIRGEEFAEIYTTADRDPGVPGEDLAAAAAAAPVVTDGWGVRRDGSRFRGTLSITPIRDRTAQLTGFTAITRESPARKETQRDDRGHVPVKEAYEFIEGMSDGVCSVDGELRFMYMNEYARQVFDLEDPIGGRLDDLLSLPTALERALGEARDSREVTVCEIHYEQLEAWWGVRVYPSESGLLIHFRTITEHKKCEQEVARFTRAAKAAGLAISMFDVDREITYVNRAFEELTGHSADEALGTVPAAFRPGTSIGTNPDRLWETITEGEIWEGELIGRRPTGERYYAEHTIAPVRDANGEIERFVSIQHEITERREREQLQETHLRMQSTIADLGQQALHVDDLDDLLETAAMMVADALGTDCCRILAYDDETETLNVRAGSGAAEYDIESTGRVPLDHHSPPAHAMTTGEPVVVEDRATDPRFGDTFPVSAAMEGGISVVIGPADDPWGVLCTYETRARRFTTTTVNFVQSVANVLATAATRTAYERESRRQRDAVVALNDLNTVVNQIVETVIEQSTREDIEQVVCDALARTDAYEFAWIAEVDVDRTKFTPRTAAGTDGYEEDISISLEPDHPGSEGPGATAIRERETQVVRDVFADPSFEPWRDAAAAYGFSAVASIPIIHDDIVYGVLGVYADRPNAFDTAEQRVIGHLGEVIGYAIAAAERKRALVSDEVIELDFLIPDWFEHEAPDVSVTGTITINETIALEDGRFLMYGTGTPAGVASLKALVDAGRQWNELVVLDDRDPQRFELHLAESPVTEVVFSLGGYVEEGTIEDGDLQTTVHLSPTADVRRLLDAIMEQYPQTELLSRRQVRRTRDDPRRLQGEILRRLTHRQHDALSAAYHAGYFEWPRDATGEELAESFDIAPSTFHQHLRKGERKVIEAAVAEGLVAE